MDDGGTGVLAERENTLYGCFGIAEELQSHIFVVVACFRISKDSSDLLVVRAAKHELAIME